MIMIAKMVGFIFHVVGAGFRYFAQFYHDYKIYTFPFNSGKLHDLTP
jgi:hypothetical protein